MAKMIESVASRAQTPFENAPFTDFTKEENRRAQLEALEQVKSELGQTYPLIIGGKKISIAARPGYWLFFESHGRAGKRSGTGSRSGL